ncbi:MAG TPA: alpha/beta fold hydrolase [Chitinophagaceae bacterium]|nr:alpha/beta fold hydrolase [Chitinophagaceae bacterium]
MNRKKILRRIKVVLIIYCLVGLGVYYFQEVIFFRPVPLPKDHAYNFAQPHKEILLPYNEKSGISIVQFTTAGTAAKGVVLYFHGNRTNISRYESFAPVFTKHGYEVWMIDYPGYGKSTGEFTEQTLYDWALVFYKLARVRFSPDSIIIYGKSLGSGVAAQLASVRDCRNLILETPYYDFPSIAGQYLPIYPVRMMVRFKIPTYQYLQKVTAPITIFHGTSDGVIWHSNASRLKPFLKPRDEFITIAGGSHNDLAENPIYQQKIIQILEAGIK